MGSILNVEELDSYLGCHVSSLPIGSAFGSSTQGQAHLGFSSGKDAKDIGW